VENAIEIAYKSLEQNEGKRVFLLSEMIHNPNVNNDLLERGVRFLREHNGKQLIPWDELKSDDIVIVPAFGTTLEIQQMLKERGIDPYEYDTTCPFVEKVWNRAEALGRKHYTIVVHGKYNHEETIATFSHSKQNSPTIVVRNVEETKLLRDIILGKIPSEEFYTLFEGKFSAGFDVNTHLERVGVVNQTTMLATETQAIADMMRVTMILKFGAENIKEHYADTSDTLCYATYDNQQATLGLLKGNADFAIVVGGYNSSNTSHIVELCEEKLPVYFVSGAEKIISDSEISHFDIHKQEEVTTRNWLNQKSGRSVEIILTSGASCPDAILDEVLQKIVAYFPDSLPMETALAPFNSVSVN